MRRWLGVLTAVAAAAATLGPVGARADMPWPPPPSGQDPYAYQDYLRTSTLPPPANDWDPHDYKLTSEVDPSVPLTAQELGGVMGASVDKAWTVSTGRPDVRIAVLDSGIVWNDAGAMRDLRDKVYLNWAELPPPEYTDAHGVVHTACTGVPLPPRRANTPFPRCYDVDGNGVFDVRDYATDPRVNPPAHAYFCCGPGQPGMLTPEDLIEVFTCYDAATGSLGTLTSGASGPMTCSNGAQSVDNDHDGFAHDIAGWNFMERTNDPYDEPHYGHGTGEARDSNAEANNGGDIGSCPSCMVMPLKVGDSFIADVNDFAQAVLFAVDQGAAVIQEALGTLNHSSLGQAAIDYAYRHGVVVVASAADEEEGHHNWPSNYVHTLVVNSIRSAEIGNQPPATGLPQPGRSYLVLNGCTNYGGHIVVSVPSSSCSSEATGKAAGMLGLLESAARNEVALGHLRPYAPGLPLSAEEAKQIVTSTADDIDFEDPASPYPPDACESHPAFPPGPPANYVSLEGPGIAERFHTIAGFDQYTGYGRINATCMVRAVLGGDAGNRIPPEASIETPAWFANLDPTRRTSFPVTGRVAAVRADSYRYAVQLAFGVQPHGGNCDPTLPAQQGDWRTVVRSEVLHHPVSGTLARLSAADVQAALAAYQPASYGHVVDPNGDQSDWLAPPYSSRPGFNEWDRYTVTVRVCVADSRGLVGEDRRTLQSHHDDAVAGIGTSLEGFPLELGADGASSPVVADLFGDNRNVLVFGTSDGQVHVVDATGHELPGWPQNVSPLAYHWDEPAFRDPEVAQTARRVHSAILAGVAVGDLDRSGRLEVVAADMSGYVYVFEADGRLRPGFPVHLDADYSAPGTPPHFNRDGANRVQFGFLASPVLADLDHDGRLWIVAAALDRHVYVWDGDGHLRRGFPVLLASPEKVAAVDPLTHRLTLVPNSGADIGSKIISSPAVGDLLGDGGTEIVVGRNEEYHSEQDGGFNAAADAFPLGAFLSASNQVRTANSRVYAIFADGWCHGLKRCPATPPTAVPGNAYVPGWPVKVGLLQASLLPYVGTGINTGPALARFPCPRALGGDHPGLKVGVFSAIGPAYVFQSDGSSCYGQGPGADGRLHDRTLDGTLPGTPPGAGSATDVPYVAAVGQAAFADLGNGDLVLLGPSAGLRAVLDLVLDDHQLGAEKSVTAWSVTTGQAHPGFPAYVNDAEFLNGPIAADLLGTGTEDVISGSALSDLRAVDASGNPVAGFDKNTGDWMVATPLVAPLGPLDGHRDLVAVTRAGTLFAWNTPSGPCAGASWPRFRHDLWNSGNLGTVADRPETITDLALDTTGGSFALRFTAPHGHGACGNADHYEVRALRCPTTASGVAVPSAFLEAPAHPAGTAERLGLPRLPAESDVLAVAAANDAGRAGGNLAAAALLPLRPLSEDCLASLGARTGGVVAAVVSQLPATAAPSVAGLVALILPFCAGLVALNRRRRGGAATR